MKRNRDLLLGIFMLSLSLITFEIGLTRLFSAIFNYHYVFLVLSFSVLGLGLGGFVLHLTAKDETGWVSLVQKGYGWVYLFTLCGIYFLPFLKSPVIYIMIGTIPFLFGGYLLAYYFKQKDMEIGRLYFADLLGSTVGVIVIFFVFQKLGVFPALIFMTAVAFFSTSLLEKGKRIRLTLAILALVLLSILLIPGLEDWGNQAFEAFYTSPHSTINGRNSEYTHWDGFARTDVYTSNENQKIILLDGSAAAPMNQFDGDLGKVQHMKDWIGYLPFKMVGGEKVLVIGPGGGEDILNAFLAGIEDITAVEVNPGSVEAVRQLADFSGAIYDDSRVKTFVQDGRNFVERNTERYDHIYLSVVMTNVADTGSKVLVENYIYTQEAIAEYLKDLNENGYVTFLMHQQSDSLRLLSTVINLLKKQGISTNDIVKQLVIYYDPTIKHGGHQMMYPVLMVKKTPFSRTEAKDFVEQIDQSGYSLLTMPYIFENPLFKKLASGEYSYRVFEEQLGFNMRPVTDDHPFIYQAQRGIPQYLITLLFVIGIGLMVSYKYGSTEFRKFPHVVRKMSYFVMLGFGFMMIEIVMMQMFAVYLGYPILTFISILGVLLLSSGIGSYVSEAFSRRINPLLLVGLYGSFLTITIPFLVQKTIHLGLPLKVLLIFTVLAPLGFSMGMGFPVGIRHLKAAREEELIPLIWAMNGIASVGGSALGITIALLSGFQVVSWIGIAFYIIGYFSSQGIFFEE